MTERYASSTSVETVSSGTTSVTLGVAGAAGVAGAGGRAAAAAWPHQHTQMHACLQNSRMRTQTRPSQTSIHAKGHTKGYRPALPQPWPPPPPRAAQTAVSVSPQAGPCRDAHLGTLCESKHTHTHETLLKGFGECHISRKCNTNTTMRKEHWRRNATNRSTHSTTNMHVKLQVAGGHTHSYKHTHGTHLSSSRTAAALAGSLRATQACASLMYAPCTALAGEKDASTFRRVSAASCNCMGGRGHKHRHADRRMHSTC